MGCGKSSIGRELSALLGCPAVDLDEVIQHRAGREIHEIFEAEGEAGFRRRELEALREILGAGGGSQVCDSEVGVMIGCTEVSCSQTSAGSGSVNLILALGGGTLTTPECAALVHEKTTCIYLRATIDTLVENLEEDGVANRPMLSGIRSQNSERSPIDTESPQLEASQQNGEKLHTIALRNRITELMATRAQNYEKTAHHIIDIDGETPRETAVKISELLNTN